MGQYRIYPFAALRRWWRDLDNARPERRCLAQLTKPFMQLCHPDQRHEIEAVDIKRATKAGPLARIIAQFALRPCEVKPQRPGGRVCRGSPRVKRN